jgi:hypothetical protein
VKWSLDKHGADPENWVNYANLTSDQKRTLYYDLWDFSQRTDATTCSTCFDMDTAIFPSTYPCKTCEDWYKYKDWTATNGTTVDEWINYASKTTLQKQTAWRDYYEWQKTSDSKCSECQQMPSDILPASYPCTDCGDLYNYLNSSNSAYLTTVTNWLDYTNQTADTKRALFHDYYEWQKGTENKCDDCKKLPTDIAVSNFPCTTCGSWYEYQNYAKNDKQGYSVSDGSIDTTNTTVDKSGYPAIWLKDQTEANRDEYQLAYADYNHVFIKQNTYDPKCTNCVAANTTIFPVSESFLLAGFTEDQWSQYQTLCGVVKKYQELDAKMETTKTNIKTQQANGVIAYTASSNDVSNLTYFKYAPYYITELYIKYIDTTKDRKTVAQLIYDNWLTNPITVNLKTAYETGLELEQAYAYTKNLGLTAKTDTRACDEMFPEPDVWKNYKQSGYAYSTWDDTVSSGGCETDWCAYVDWVQKKVAANDTTVNSLDWIYDWYQWQIYYKYPDLGTGSDNFTKQGSNGARDKCINHKRQYCLDLGTYCDGMTQQFKDAWGKNANGGYDSKTMTDGTTMTIYGAWCKMYKDNKYKTAWENLATYEATATTDLATFDTIKSEVQKYWNYSGTDTWTMDNNSTAISGDTAAQVNTTCKNGDVCYTIDKNKDTQPLASKCFVGENSKTDMPWVWKYKYKRTTNEWYMWILFGDNTSRSSNMHNLDSQLKICNEYYNTILGTTGQNGENDSLKYGTCVKSDYNDFTAPKWWGTWMVVGNGVSTDGIFYHPNTGQVVTGSQYARTNWVWKLPSNSSDDLRNMLTWFIFDYQDWIKNNDHWYQSDSSIADSTGVKTYNIGHHGNIWCSIWQQAIARISGNFYNDTENKWYHHSVLCGYPQDQYLISGTTLTQQGRVSSPAAQLYATMANALNAMKFYDRYYGEQTSSSGGTNGYGKILGFHKAEGSELQQSGIQAVFNKTQGAMWSESFYTTDAISNSYPCKAEGDRKNCVKYCVATGSTENLKYFFTTWSNDFSSWSNSTSADGTTQTYTPQTSNRKLALARYNAYVNACSSTSTNIPLVTQSSCNSVGVTDSDLVNNTPTATTRSSTSTSP